MTFVLLWAKAALVIRLIALLLSFSWTLPVKALMLESTPAYSLVSSSYVGFQVYLNWYCPIGPSVISWTLLLQPNFERDTAGHDMF